MTFLDWLRMGAACLLASFLTAMFMDDPDGVDHERMERIEGLYPELVDKLARLTSVVADQAEGLRDHAVVHAEAQP